MFDAENFYESVSEIIKYGNSYIYRTDALSFQNPTGTQAVVRYSYDDEHVLVVVNSFKNAKALNITLDGNYIIENSLYKSNDSVSGNVFKIDEMSDFSGNVYLLKKE